MAWWRRAWSWLRDHWRWVVLPVGLILAVLPWLRRERTPSPSSGAGQGGGPTGDEAEEIRRTIREAEHGESEDVRARAEADRERIRRALGRGGGAAALVAVMLLEAGCPRPVRLPPPPLPALDGICEPWIVACEAGPRDDLCGAAMACVDAREVGQLCVAQLRACESLAAVDVGEQAAYRAAAEARVGELEDQRWWWGAGGVAVGALLAGLLAGLAGR